MRRREIRRSPLSELRLLGSGRSRGRGNSQARAVRISWHVLADSLVDRRGQGVPVADAIGNPVGHAIREAVGKGVCHAVGLKHRGTSRHATRMSLTEWDLSLGVIGRGSLATGSGTAAVVVGGDLGLDASSVGQGANLRQDGADSLDETVLLVRRGVLEGSLDNVVGERVADQPLRLLGSKHLLDNHILGRGLRASQTLLDDVGAELVTRELADAAAESLHDRLRKGRLVEIYDVLHDIVAEGILDEDAGVLRDALDQPQLLIA